MTTEFSTELSAPFGPGGLPPQGEAGTSLNIKRLLRLRGRFMVITSVVLALPLMIAAWFLVPAEYEASNFIAIQATRPGVLREGQSPSSVDYDRYVATQVSLIKGPTILAKVVNDPAVRDLPWIRNQKDPLHFLMDKVDAKVQPSSELIRISCRSTDRAAAMTVVSKIVETYVRYVSSIESEGIGQRRKLLVEEREAIQKRMEEQRARIADMKRTAGVTIEGSTPVGEIGLQFYHDRLGQAQAELSTAQSNVSRLENLVAEVQKIQARHQANPTEPVYEMGVEEKVSSDPAVQALRQQEVTVARRIADMETKYVEDAPPLKAERETLATVQNQIEQTKARLRTDELNTIFERHRLELAAAQKQVEDAQGRVDQFKQTIQEHEKKLEDLAQSMATIEEEEAKLEQMRKEYDQFVESIRLLDVEERAPGRVNEPSATVAPEKPQYGKRLQFMLLALVFSVGAGVCLGVFREMNDQHIRMPQDLKPVTDLPVLAAIPDAASDKLPRGVNPARLSVDFPNSTTADQYRRIITRIIYPPEGSAELNTVLVTSPSQGDGKTSLACNLACALAQAERRVLLVDISARRPGVERCFGMEPSEGLEEIFSKGRQPRDVVRETSVPNLFLIGPGRESDVVAEKLASRELVEFLEEAEKAFDHVIIDSPPALLMSDAKLLSPVVDGVVLVVGSEVSTLGMTRRCITELRQVGANLVGIVLNKLKPTRWGYLQENLGKYYAYGKEPSTPSDSSRRGANRVSQAKKPEPEAEELSSIILLEDEDVPGQNMREDSETRSGTDTESP